MNTRERLPSSERLITGRTALIGLLAIQIVVGYEWLMSGLVKIARGGFPSGLADELTEKSEGLSGWYKSFLDGTVIPNASTFGVLIEIGEVAVGVALIGAALLWLLRWDRFSDRVRIGILLATALGAAGGIFMNVNFHLANGSSHPWLIPPEGFDEGVDLDSIMPLIQVILLGFSTWLLLLLRRERKLAAADARGRANANVVGPAAGEAAGRRPQAGAPT